MTAVLLRLWAAICAPSDNDDTGIQDEWFL